MASIIQRKCDVFGTKNKVSGYRLKIERIDGEENLFGIEPVWVDFLEWSGDLSPKAVQRLAHFLHRATTPPDKKAKKIVKPGTAE